MKKPLAPSKEPSAAANKEPSAAANKEPNNESLILTSPAAERNSEPLFNVVNAELSALGETGKTLKVLELASGSGQHVALFAERCRDVQWQPSDLETSARVSIDARVVAAGLANVEPALALDARETWPAQTFDLILAANLVHISPWEVTKAVMAGAAAALDAQGTLLLYGPYRRDGVHTAQGNIDFDADLRRRNPQWGIRDLEEVATCAQTHGLHRLRTVEMPANNLCLLFSR